MMWQGINFSRRLLLLSALVLLVGIGFWGIRPQSIAHSSSLEQSKEVPRFVAGNCQSLFSEFEWNNNDRNRFRCGYLITWKNYDLQEQGGTIHLAVMETYPRKDPKPAPVIWLAGGPGASGFLYNNENAKIFSDGIGRVFIQFSQRGTYLSRTEISDEELLCDEYPAAIKNNWERELDFEQWNPIKYEALKGCSARLKNELTIEETTIFNSEFNALDVIYLIRALGYGNENVNLYGGSYGTLLAQHVLALSPDDIRSVVLDGVAPLGVDWEADFALNVQNSLELIFDACSEECKKAYPNLRQTFYSLLDQLDDEPVTISVKDNGD